MMSKGTVLVVDDDVAMREMLVSLLEEHGTRAAAAGDAEEALERIRTEEFDAVLSDIRMPGKSGIELVGEIREARPDTPVILMTAFGTIDSAGRRCVRAFDYITSPSSATKCWSCSSAPSSVARSKREPGCAAPSILKQSR